MRKAGVEHGSAYAVEWMEEQLGVERNAETFGRAISAIRKELEFDGFYLRAEFGKRFVILRAEDNDDVVLRHERHAIELLRRAVVLGSNTDTRGFSEQQLRRHESILAHVAQRHALASRKLPGELPE